MDPRRAARMVVARIRKKGIAANTTLRYCSDSTGGVSNLIGTSCLRNATPGRACANHQRYPESRWIQVPDRESRALAVLRSGKNLGWRRLVHGCGIRLLQPGFRLWSQAADFVQGNFSGDCRKESDFLLKTLLALRDNDLWQP